MDWSAAARTLTLRYRLACETAQLLLPATTGSRRADGLWQHTCFEVFIRPAGTEAYCEFNFSPSGEWAAYRFTSRREGMQSIDAIEPPSVRLAPAPDGLAVTVVLQAGSIDGLTGGRALDLGLSAIIEDLTGGLSYWALRHASPRPDFHDPASFALRLDPVLGFSAVPAPP